MVQSEDNTRFPPNVETELRGCGWFPGRDVSEQLVFPPEKNVFPAAMDIFREFGLLNICYDYQDCDGIGGQIFMNEEQMFSEILFQNELSYCSTRDEAKDSELVKQNGLTDVTLAERILNVPCCYLGDYDHGDTTGAFDIYVTEFGEIYTGQLREVYRAADSFDEFLINWLQEDLLYDVTKKRDRPFSQRLKQKLLFWM